MQNKTLSIAGAILFAAVCLCPTTTEAQAPKKKEVKITVPENILYPKTTKADIQKKIDSLVEWLNANYPDDINDTQAFIARKLTDEEKRELQRQKAAKKAAKKNAKKEQTDGNTANTNTTAENGEEDEEEDLTKRGRFVNLSTVAFLREYTPFSRFFRNADAIADFEEIMEIRSNYYREMNERLKKLENKIQILNGIRSTGNAEAFHKGFAALRKEMRDIASIATNYTHDRLKADYLAQLRKQNAARRRAQYIAQKKKEMAMEAENTSNKKGGNK